MSTIKVTFEFPERWLEHVEHHEERLQLAREGQFYAADYDSQEEAERAEASALEGAYGCIGRLAVQHYYDDEEAKREAKRRAG